jgi:hypothetical protein
MTAHSLWYIATPWRCLATAPLDRFDGSSHCSPKPSSNGQSIVPDSGAVSEKYFPLDIVGFGHYSFSSPFLVQLFLQEFLTVPACRRRSVSVLSVCIKCWCKSVPERATAWLFRGTGQTVSWVAVG